MSLGLINWKVLCTLGNYLHNHPDPQTCSASGTDPVGDLRLHLPHPLARGGGGRGEMGRG